MLSDAWAADDNMYKGEDLVGDVSIPSAINNMGYSLYEALPEHGIEMHYRCNRMKIDPSLPTLLCIPHIFIGSCTFRPMLCAPELQWLNIVAIELRQCGDTKLIKGKPYDEEKTLKTCAEEVVTFMNHLNIEKAFLMGGVVGAMACLHVALLAPERVKGLILGAPLHPAGESSAEVREQFMSYAEAFEADKAGGVENDISDELIEGIFYPLIPQDEEDIWMTWDEFYETTQKRFGAGKTIDAARQQLHYLLEREPILEEDLASIKAPCVIVQPTHDVRDEVCHGEATKTGLYIQQALKNAKGGVKIEHIESNTSCLCMRKATLSHLISFVEANRIHA